MATISSLLSQAAQVRDAVLEDENTALRVGSMFVDLLLALQSALPSEIIDGWNIDVIRGTDNVKVCYGTVGFDGTTAIRSVFIPAVTDEVAGVMTPSQLKELRSAIDKVRIGLLDYGTSLQAVSETANSALSLATATAVKIGSAGGIAPLGSDGKVPAAYLPEEVLGGGGGEVVVVDPVAISTAEIDAMFRSVSTGPVMPPGGGDLELNPVG